MKEKSQKKKKEIVSAGFKELETQEHMQSEPILSTKKLIQIYEPNMEQDQISSEYRISSADKYAKYLQDIADKILPINNNN